MKKRATLKKETITNSKEASSLWAKSDDAISTSRLIGELYENAPKGLKNIRVKVLEFHEFDCSVSQKKKLKSWLNRD